jgi:hypothetical protein
VSRERGQATVELVAFAAVAAVVAIALHAVLVVRAGQGRAQGIADQAAVLVAEGRPVPARLRREADVAVHGRSVVVTVSVAPAVGLGRVDLIARAALPG